ncbi:MAG: hypothetical protein Q8862_03140, partial [Bacteroidota bacterium]|nr:hypothetical protein [Bacteroidota bacterium]
MHNLILKYCKGNYTNEELVKATKLFKSEENDIAIAEVMQLQWNLCDNSEIGDKAEFDRILNQVHSIINLDAAQPSATKRFFIGLSRIAAILVIPLILSVFLLLQHNRSKNRLEAENTIAAPKGAIKQLRLSDGTLVWLNS